MDPKQPVKPHDYTQGDQEDFRRGRNQERRRYRRRGRRAKWMDMIEEKWPEKHAELVELRRVSPMKFRKALARFATEEDFYEFVNRCSPRDLPPLEERRREEEDR